MVKLQKRILYRVFSAYLSLVLVVSYAIPPRQSYAQSVLNLPQPGAMLGISPIFTPPSLAGITIYPQNPLQFDFIIDTGDDDLQGAALRKESEKLIKYFMTTLTVPEKEMWVNLSPYEKNRIIANGLGNTQMGIDMLVQDYILKQLTASLMYPEEKIGSEFWERVYNKAQEKYGMTEIPMNTFNKIWIVPESASVQINGNSIFIVDSYLKVMLEEDYLALESNLDSLEHGVGDTSGDEALEINGVTAEIVRDILIPEIEREVNEGKNFVTLRQIFYSMILATWYKQNLKESVLGQIYVDKNKIDGVDIDDKESKQKVYEQYIKAFEKGVYNYIKEDYDAVNQKMIPRKYFSGGEDFAQLASKVSEVESGPIVGRDGGKYVIAKSGVDPISSSPTVNRRSFLTMLGIGVAAMIVNPLTLLAQTFKSLAGREIREVFGFFSANSHKTTGLSLSHFGDRTPHNLYGAQTYDMTLRAIGDVLGKGEQIMTTYMKKTVFAQGESNPQTYTRDYLPSGGFLSHIRIKRFEEEGWWQPHKGWEFKVATGDNAWVGIAALQNFARTGKKRFLAFAKDRAEYVLKFQDKDGGIRYGPKGQHTEGGDLNLRWNSKSTEGSESTLAFLDMIYSVTGEKRYKLAADRIYDYLITEMYDPATHTFYRGEAYVNRNWIKDDPKYFSPDVISWAPIDRILEDSRFGSNRFERLAEFEKMLDVTVRERGVIEDGVLKGVTFPYGRNNKIVHVEWSAQFALRYLRVSKEFGQLKKKAKGDRIRRKSAQKEEEYLRKYSELTSELGKFFVKKDQYLIAPYAIYTDGRIAKNVPTDLGWNTPQGYSSVATVYYGFALAKFDPLILDKSTLGAQLSSSGSSSLSRSVFPKMLDLESQSVNILPAAMGAVSAKLAVSSFSFPGKVGIRELQIRYPSFFQRDGQTYMVDVSQVKSVLNVALQALQVERADFDVSRIDRIDIVESTEFELMTKTNGVMEVPLSLVISQRDARSHLEGNVEVLLDKLREEFLKVVLLHEESESHSLSPEELVALHESYLEKTFSASDPEMPYYPKAPPADYQIIVPIYNEGNILDLMLTKMKDGGYLDKITFVNDASTDSSGEILDRWVESDGINVIHMETNQKKEGAVTKALQIKKERNGGVLPKKTILLDSDTFFDLSGKNTTLDDVIAQVNAYMDDEKVDGISFRIDAYLPENPNIFELMHYFSYVGNRQFDRFTSKDDQLRVAYGPAGMFTTDVLFKILENIEPDFETGDAVITVEMMKLGRSVRYYPDLRALTRSPSNYVDFFKLHRRWERGGLKVLIKEWSFYANLFKSQRRLVVPVLINFMFYFGVFGGALYNVSFFESFSRSLSSFGYGLITWAGINLALILSERNVIKEKERLVMFKIFLRAFPFVALTILPSRLAGVMDVISSILRGKSRDPLKDRDSGKIKHSSNEESSSSVKPGGIDLNSDLLDLQTQGGGIEYDIPLDLQNVESMPIQGFSPVIYQIVPIQSLPMLFGDSQSQELQQLSAI